MSRRTRSFNLFAILLTLGLSGTLSLSAREISVAVFDSAQPIVFVDDQGRPGGFFPDILRRILEEQGHRPVFVTGMSFAEAYDRVSAGEIDLLPAAVHTESRDRQLDFNAEPVLVSWGQLGTRPEDSLESILELRDAKVGMLRDGQNGTNFTEMMSMFDIPFEPVFFASFDQITAAILSGEVRVGVFFNAWFWNSDRVLPSSIIFAPTQGFIATADGTNQDILGGIDGRLRELKQDEASYYYQLLDQWLWPSRAASVPQWIWISGTAVTGALLIFLSFTLFLRRKVADATSQLAESTERYRTVANYAHGWEFWMTPSGQFFYVSPNTRALTGYNAEQFERDPTTAERIVLEEDRDTWQRISEHARRPIQRELTGSAFRIRRADGEIRWIEHRGTSVFSDDGEFRGYRGTNIDVTERMMQQQAIEAALTERSVLLKEIHHRVKNNLQTIASLISIQQHNMNPKAARHLDAIAARVHAMGALHAVLYQEERFGEVDLNEYASSILHHVHGALNKDRSITTTIEIPELRLRLEQALPVGLLINEILTNAYKHAFKEDSSGTITLRVASESEDTIRLSVRDDGKGLSAECQNMSGASGGIGLPLIESLAQQLDGELTIVGTSGTTISVVFRLS